MDTFKGFIEGVWPGFLQIEVNPKDALSVKHCIESRLCQLEWGQKKYIGIFHDLPRHCTALKRFGSKYWVIRLRIATTGAGFGCTISATYDIQCIERKLNLINVKKTEGGAALSQLCSRVCYIYIRYIANERYIWLWNLTAMCFLTQRQIDCVIPTWYYINTGLVVDLSDSDTHQYCFPLFVIHSEI